MLDTSCVDWIERIKAGRSLVPAGVILDAGEGARAVRVFNRLRLPDVVGNPPFAQAAGEWFTDIIRALFGSLDPATGERMIREVFCLVPKKQSKTTNGAGLMLTALLMSQRPRAEFLLVAPTLEVADLSFAQAVGMIELDAALLKRLHIQAHIKRITDRLTGCFLKVKSFEPKVVTGTRPAGVLIDETHAISDQHDADRVVGQLRGGLISQPEGFLIQITTQSERPPAGVFLAELLKARAVRDGTLKAPILPVLYEFPKDVQWRSRENWPMVLPNLGRSVTLARLESDYETAHAAGPQEERRWASQHLNVQIGQQLAYDSWAGAAFWDVSEDEDITLESLLERCEAVALGVDGGGFDDMLGLTVVGRERDTGRWLSWSRAWLHEIALERRLSEVPTYRDLEQLGELVILPNESRADFEEVADIAERLYLSGLLTLIGVDPICISDVLDELDARGIPPELIKSIPQGWRLAGYIQTSERRLAAGTLVHAAQRLMSYCVGNAKVEFRGNTMLVTKVASGRAKIDPLIALFNAVGIMAQNPQPAGSVYDALGGQRAKDQSESEVPA